MTNPDRELQDLELEHSIEVCKYLESVNNAMRDALTARASLIDTLLQKIYDLEKEQASR